MRETVREQREGNETGGVVDGMPAPSDTMNTGTALQLGSNQAVTLALLPSLSPGALLLLTFRPMLESWTLRGSLEAAAIPAAGYALQNWLSQLAYMNLDSLTFNLLNQTKTLFAALCLYLVMGKKQSRLQLVALSLLLAAALLLNSSSSGGDSKAGTRERGLLTSEAEDSSRLWLGVLPVMAAALMSGLMGAITQRTLQRSGRNASQLSLELAVYGVLTLLLTSGSGIGGSDAVTSAGRSSAFQGWTKWTFIPVLSQAAGGLIVGQVNSICTSGPCCASLVVAL